MSLKTGRRVSGNIARVLPITNWELIKNNLEFMIADCYLNGDQEYLVDDDLYLLDHMNDDDLLNEDTLDREEVKSQSQSVMKGYDDDNFEQGRDNTDVREVTDGEDSSSVTDVSIDSADEDKDIEFESEYEEDNSISYDDSKDEEENDNKSSHLDEEDSHPVSITYKHSDTFIDESFDDSFSSPEQNESKTSNCSDDAHPLFGRGQRVRAPNPRFFNEDFTHLQFLQHTFESLDTHM